MNKVFSVAALSLFANTGYFTLTSARSLRGNEKYSAMQEEDAAGVVQSKEPESGQDQFMSIQERIRQEQEDKKESYENHPHKRLMKASRKLGKPIGKLAAIAGPVGAGAAAGAVLGGPAAPLTAPLGGFLGACSSTSSFLKRKANIHKKLSELFCEDLNYKKCGPSYGTLRLGKVSLKDKLSQLRAFETGLIAIIAHKLHYPTKKTDELSIWKKMNLVKGLELSQLRKSLRNVHKIMKHFPEVKFEKEYENKFEEEIPAKKQMKPSKDSIYVPENDVELERIIVQYRKHAKTETLSPNAEKVHNLISVK